jgi:hypothetical protein
MEIFNISSFNYKYKVTNSDSLRNPTLKYYTETHHFQFIHFLVSRSLKPSFFLFCFNWIFPLRSSSSNK